MDWVIAGTWPFAKQGLAAAVPLLNGGAGAVEAIEAAIRVVEDDERVDSVGVGGGPNAQCEMELDAAMMDGHTLSLGAVGALKGIRHPISVAVKLMATKHTFLVGEGARRFALENGFVMEDLLTDASRERYKNAVNEMETRLSGPAVNVGHDTVGIVARDAEGRFAAGTSTSGLFFKPMGRLGDSPLPGSGFYADDALGAAVATGMGEDLMRGVVCRHALLLTAQGTHPTEAARGALLNIILKRRRAGFEVGELSMIVMNAQGIVGAATNINVEKKGFPYAYARQGAHEGSVALLQGECVE